MKVIRAIKDFRLGRRIRRLLLRLTRVENDLIIFDSFLGRYISDSPLAIFEHIDREKYRCYFIVEQPENFEGYPTIRKGSFRAFYYLSKAKFVISNVRMPLAWKKKKGQVYLQTWHGTPLKRLVYDQIAFDAPSAPSFEEYCVRFTKDSDRWDYLFSSCSYASEKFKSAFRASAEILEIGYPRNHKLYHHTSEDIFEIKKKLGIPPEKKVLLYAPTYRDNQNVGAGRYFFNDELDYELLSKDLSDTVILLRYHYLVNQGERLECENVIDVSSYQDINDLFLISDILVTDYSSVFFDYSILKRPFFFFTPDFEEYESELRGFYLDMNQDLPVKPVRTTEELIQQIKQSDEIDFEGFFSLYNPEKNKECIQRTLDLIDTICEDAGGVK